MVTHQSTNPAALRSGVKFATQPVDYKSPVTDNRLPTGNRKAEPPACARP